jgi:hypothetical protein
MSDLSILGWREWIGFPDLGIEQIKAKLDTGARTSCLHAFRLEPFERGGALWLRFDIHPSQTDNKTVLQCEAPVRDQRIVRDSGGHEELRYVLETTMTIGGLRKAIEVTLTDRDTMKFRVLLGRTALQGSFAVDPSRSYLVGKRKKVTGIRPTTAPPQLNE